MNQLIAFDDLIQGRLIARYKRFFADIALPDGAVVTAHCPNPGKMLGLLAPDAPALVTRLPGSNRKLGYRLEALRAAADFGATWVGVNTQWPNRLTAQAKRAKDNAGAWLEMSDIFGELAQNPTYVAAFSAGLRSAWSIGAKATLEKYLAGQPL